MLYDISKIIIDTIISHYYSNLSFKYLQCDFGCIFKDFNQLYPKSILMDVYFI